MKLSPNLIITIVIVIAVCLVALVFSYSVYSRTLPISQPTIQPTPEPTPEIVQPTPAPTVITPVPTSAYAYLDYIQAGTDKVNNAKKAVESGKTLLIPALAIRSNYNAETNAVFSAKQNFTSAKNLYVNAQEDYSNALKTAPPQQVATLNVLISTLNAIQRNTDTYISSSDYALAGDWYSANDAYNRANIGYQSNMGATNQLLAAMNLIS
ncbi:MAG: hypothetical protein MUF37_06360 [Methanoregulaceae archaeon]|jgi:hypothetical protein|nr:hypothetical protein [Methanoregulaceae archaeon]